MNILLYSSILGFFVVWALYRRWKFLNYCRKHYPEKVPEFLRLGELTLIKAIFMKHTVDDLEFVILKNYAKNAYACVAFCLLFAIFLLFCD
jgi:hypothetical protein